MDCPMRLSLPVKAFPCALAAFFGQARLWSSARLSDHCHVINISLVDQLVNNFFRIVFGSWQCAKTPYLQRVSAHSKRYGACQFLCRIGNHRKSFAHRAIPARHMFRRSVDDVLIG